ncbi:MAG TPA: hypothetical protein VFV15_06310 [Moraxellaceae bacterium]|nr:hypothetical protein [Moraxellaceae bacterium]
MSLAVPLRALLLLLLPALLAATAHAVDAPAAADGTPTDAPPGAQAELIWELDPYYSSAAWEIPLTDAPLPDGGRLPEREVYGRLLRNALHPRLLLLEASVYPLPVAGTWFKRNHASAYDDLQVGTLGNNQLNLVDGVTAGFQEPWALSVFVGNGMQFRREGEPANARNRGYMGWLVSWGARHIQDNVLIRDRWWELEWKLKGEREFRDEELDWSFRLGVKNHGNADIADVAYLGLRRSNLDYASSWLSLLDNTDLDLLTEVDRHSGRYLRQEAIVGRKVPLRRWRVALSLDLGVIYEDRRKYSGALADPGADTLTFVVRPHLRF